MWQLCWQIMNHFPWISLTGVGLSARAEQSSRSLWTVWQLKSRGISSVLVLSLLY